MIDCYGQITLLCGAQGDLIPWTVGQQFQDADFPALSGARVVRIAVHPELGRAGYGSRALELLRRYYEVSRRWALPLPKQPTWAGTCVLTCMKTSGQHVSTFTRRVRYLWTAYQSKTRFLILCVL